MKRKPIPRRMGLFALLVFIIILSIIWFYPTKTYYQGYIEGTNIYIASPYDGYLKRKYVVKGQKVKKDELLFQIEPNPEELVLNQLKAAVTESVHSLKDIELPRRPLEIKALEDQVKQIEASLELAQLRLKRLTELYKKQAVDLDHLDEARSVVKQLEASKDQAISNLELSQLGARIQQIKAQKARVSQAEFALKVGEWKIAQKTLKAPADGFMFDTYYQEGEFVPATRPIGALLPLDQLHLEFFVPVSELPHFYLNQTIIFKCESCKEESKATLDYISPEAEYIPPLVYSRDNNEKIVFKIRARLSDPLIYKVGQPVLITGFEHAK